MELVPYERDPTEIPSRFHQVRTASRYQLWTRKTALIKINVTMLVPWSWTQQPPELWERNGYCYPVCDILLQQPEQTKKDELKEWEREKNYERRAQKLWVESLCIYFLGKDDIRNLMITHHSRKVQDGIIWSCGSAINFNERHFVLVL